MDKSENTETTQTKEPIPGWNLMESDVVFLVLPLVLTILVPTGAILYSFGRLSWHAGLLGLFHLAAVGFIVCCFLASAARLLTGWRKYTRKRKFIGIARVATPIAFVVLFMMPVFVPSESDSGSHANAFTYGFRDRIGSKANIPAIRDWLRTVDKGAYDEHGDRLPPDQWPESLKALKPPRSVLLEADSNGNPRIRIIWGAAIFHWGVTIGLEDMVIPPARLDEWYESWLLVEPGVYVWDW